MSEMKVKAPRPPRARNPFNPLKPTTKPQEYYDEIKQRFAEERNIRLHYRPEGRDQYIYDLEGDLAKYETDPRAD